MNHVEQHLADKLAQRQAAGNLRRLQTARAAIDFYSNDYLGFANTGLLHQLMQPLPSGHQATGATGSRLLSGNSVQAETLEATITSFHHAEAAILFNSGYDANVGLLSSLPARNTTILYDELCHASIIDGIRLALTNNKFRFRHNDVTDLRSKLEKHRGTPVIVVVESVYSMDGDCAPLEQLAPLCTEYNAMLIVDEAHATGVFGDHGEGLVCALGLQEKVAVRVHTFGKALGCHGAALVGSKLLRDYLINFARSFIYTTALPVHSLHAIHTAYQHMSGHSFSNKPLHELIAYFKSKVSNRQGWVQSDSAIQAYIAGSNEKAKAIAAQLQQQGIQASPILHPTVAAGSERLRICLHTYNTTQQIDLLLATIG